MVLAPNDSEAIVASVETAVSAKIPVVIIDSALNSTKPLSFVATDNEEGGKLAAKRLGEVLRGKGKVIMLRYLEGGAATEEREKGFLEGIKEFPDIQVISSDQHGGATRDNCYQASQNLLNRFGGQVNGLFTPNDSTTEGMLLARRDLGLGKEKVRQVGFDSSPLMIEALKSGELQGLILQDPFSMGYLGVKNIVAAIHGENIKPKIVTPLKVATQENMSQPEIAALLNPPVTD